MSKNLTRKGLAFGALVALASTVIAGTPASAAGEINVAPSAGTSYNTLSGTVFNLKTTFAPGFAPADFAQLKYAVTTDANSAVSYSVATSAVTAPATSVAVSTTAVTGATAGASAVTTNYIGLRAATTSVTSNVSVTAFVDSNNDGALTAGEWNTVRTVSFKKAADIVPVVTVTPVAVGDTSAKATVAWGDLNIEQISASSTYAVATGSTNSALGVDIKVNSGSYAAATYATGTFTLGSLNIAAADVVSAQAVFATNTYTAGGTPSTDVRTTVALGVAATSTASARTINTFNGLVANVVAGTDAVATAATAVAAATAAVVRTNGSFTAQVKAYDIAAGATTASTVVKSGLAVAASATTTATLVPASTGVTEKSVTLNGVKYTTSASLAAASVALTTDAAGLASVVVSTSGLADADKVTVSFKAQNITAGVEATQTAAAFTISETTASGSAVRSVVEGGSTVLNYSVKDQFGKALVGGRLVSTVGYTTAATVYTNLVDGAAALTVADSTANIVAAIPVSTTLEIQNATTSNWAPASPAVAASTQTVNVASAANAFDVDPIAASAAIATNVALTGASSAAISVNNPGASVTVSATGVTFTSNGKEYADTVTIVTGTSGDFAVSAKSNTAGAKTITFTTGAVSKTAVLTVAAAAHGTGKTLTITAPATSLPGRTVPVVVTLVDAYGNPVDTTAANAATDGQVTVTVSGIGTYTSVAAETNAAGQISFSVILPSNDSGAVTVSAKYDSNGNTADVAGATVSTTVTSVINVATPEAVSKIGTANGRVYVNVKDAKGSVVTVKIGSKWTTKTALNSDYTFSFKNTKGKKVAVKVYVDGDLSAAKTITVK